MDRGRVEGQEKHGLCRVSATCTLALSIFQALPGHRIYLTMIYLLDSLGFSRERFWDDSGTWKMDRQRGWKVRKSMACAGFRLPSTLALSIFQALPGLSVDI